MYLTPLAKQAALAGTLLMPEIRALPISTLWHIRRLLKDEKLVRLNRQVVINSFLPPFPGPAFQSMARGLQRVRRGEAVPVSAYVAVTHRCRYACWHCSQAHRAEQDLPLETLLQATSDLQALGVSIIGLTGGEPLLRDDLAQIIRAVDERSVTLLFTTGDGFTETRAAELKQSGLFGVAVSLDHYDADAHDLRRGRTGAFAAAVAAVRRSRRLGFYTMIQLVATHDLADPATLDRYLELARRLEAHEIRVLEPMPTGLLLDQDPSSRLTPAERDTLRQFHLRANRARQAPKVSAFAHIESPSLYGCGAGFQHLYIDAGGHVCPCDFTPVSFGNILHEPLALIWRRMNAAFARPRSCCFLLRHAEALRKAFDGQLPIPFEKVKDLCRCEPGEALPEFYRALGWTAGTCPRCDATDRGDWVVLLHGLGRTARSMEPLAKSFRANGFQVLNLAYPSTRAPIETLATQYLGQAVASLAFRPGQKVHFVTHSLGGIVLAHYLQRHAPANLGRVVMLAPPWRGSELADRWRSHFIYRRLTGPAGRQLGTDPSSIPNRLAPATYELGIIAGDRTLNPWTSRIIPGADDGKVSLARARAAGAKDFLVLHATHTFIMRNPDAIRQALGFIGRGRFAPRNAPARSRFLSRLFRPRPGSGGLVEMMGSCYQEGGP